MGGAVGTDLYLAMGDIKNNWVGLRPNMFSYLWGRAECRKLIKKIAIVLQEQVSES